LTNAAWNAVAHSVDDHIEMPFGKTLVGLGIDA
jgi:hypothetical protein